MSECQQQGASSLFLSLSEFASLFHMHILKFIHIFSVLRHLCQVELQLRETIPLAGPQTGWRSESGVCRNAGASATGSENGQRLADTNRARFAGGAGDRLAR